MKISFVYANSKLKSKHFKNEITRWFEQVPFAHFAILLEYGDVQNIYEARSPEFRRIDFQEWCIEYDVWKKITFDVPEAKKTLVKQWLQKWIGTKYGYFQLVVIFFSNISSVFNRLMNRKNVNKKNKLICTELGSRFIQLFLESPKYDGESHDKVGLNDILRYGREMEKQIIWKS